MDIIDNILYVNCASALRQNVAIVPFPPAQTAVAGNRITSDYIEAYVPTFPPVVGVLGMPDNVGSTADPVFTYNIAEKMDLCSYADSEVIENSILRHWYDINAQAKYDSDGRQNNTVLVPNAGQTR